MADLVSTTVGGEKPGAEGARVSERDERLKMLVSTNAQCREVSSAICHDLRAPMINLAGFSAELDADIADLERLIKNAGAAIPPSVRQALERCLHEQIRETLGFVRSSADRAAARVGEFDRLSRDSSA